MARLSQVVTTELTARFRSALALMLALALVNHGAMAADIYPLWSGDLFIDGEIVKGDYDQFVEEFLFSRADDGDYRIMLRIISPGGDAQEAMKIGRFVRSAMLFVVTVEDFPCNSSCFLIYVAGTRRYAMGPIGLHRPSFDKSYFASLSLDEATEEYKIMIQSVRKYLNEMEVPENFVERMMATRSSQADFVSADEIFDVLGRRSPSYEEWIIANCGDLSDDEWYDHRMINSLEVYQRLRATTSPLGSPHTQELDDHLAKHGGAMKHAEDLSPGYRSYVQKRANEIRLCSNAMEDQSRAKVIAELMKN